jgi:ribosomal protein L37E
MPISQDLINLEVQNRTLTDPQIEELTKPPYEVDFGDCPRCGSTSHLEIKETELISTSYGGYEIEVNSRKCRICGYNPHKDKAISWQIRLKKFLGKYAWTKLK